MLSAGAAVSWLVDDVGLLVRRGRVGRGGRALRRHRRRLSTCPRSIGLGTPQLGFRRPLAVHRHDGGTGRPELVRAVLRGVAQRGADLFEAAEADSGYNGVPPARRRRDDRQPVFVQELADACQRPVEISAELEATSLGAGFSAGLAAGVWSGLDEVAAVAKPRLVVEPAGADRRARWKEALSPSRTLDPGASRRSSSEPA